MKTVGILGGMGPEATVLLIQIPLLNMIELSVQELLENHLTKIGILASPAVKAVGVFDQSFKRSGLKFQFAQNDSNMLDMIKKSKKGEVGPSVVDAFKYESTQLLNDGCDALLVACTEFSLLSKYLPKNVMFVDSLDSLTKKIVSLAINVDPVTVRNY